MKKATANLIIATIHSMCHTVHMQSWSMSENDSRMWNEYAKFGDGVQISTTTDKAKMLEGVTCKQITYSELTLREELFRAVKINGGKWTKTEMAEIFAMKMPSYAYENEVRLISAIDLSMLNQNKVGANGEMPLGTVRELVAKMIEKGELKPSDMGTIIRQLAPNWLKYVEIKSLPEFIDGVRVSPDCTNEYLERVKSICAVHGITFLGRGMAIR